MKSCLSFQAKFRKESFPPAVATREETQTAQNNACDIYTYSAKILWQNIYEYKYHKTY